MSSGLECYTPGGGFCDELDGQRPSLIPTELISLESHLISMILLLLICNVFYALGFSSVLDFKGNTNKIFIQGLLGQQGCHRIVFSLNWMLK